MFIRHHFLKKLISFKTQSFTQNAQSLLNYNTTFKNLIPKTTFTFCSPSLQELYSHHHNDYKEDLLLLPGFNREQLNTCHEIIDKYTQWRGDLTRLTSDETESLLVILSRLGFVYRNEGNLEKAYQYLLEEQDLFKRLNIKDTFPVARNQYILASIYFDRGDLEKAENYLEGIESICGLLGEDIEAKGLVIQSRSMLGSVYAKRHEEDKALELLNSVLENVDQVPEVAVQNLLIDTYQAIGQIYIAKNELEKGMEFVEKAYRITINKFGEKSKEAFYFCADMTKYFMDKRKDTEALSFAQKSLKLALELYSGNSAEVAWINCLLCDIYLIKDDLVKSLESCKKAAKIYQKLGKNYLNPLMEAYLRIANTHQIIGNFQEATDFFEKSLNTFTMLKGEESVELAQMYIDWGYFIQGNEQTAGDSEIYFEKALEIYQRFEPSNKQKIADITRFLGDVADYEGDIDKAIQLWKKSEKILKEGSADLRKFEDVWTQLADAHFDLKNYDESLKYFNKIVGNFENTHGGVSDTRMIGTVYFNLGRVYEEKEEFKEALEAYEQALGFHKLHFGQEDMKTLATVRKVAEVLEKMHTTARLREIQGESEERC